MNLRWYDNIKLAIAFFWGFNLNPLRILFPFGPRKRCRPLWNCNPLNLDHENPEKCTQKLWRKQLGTTGRSRSPDPVTIGVTMISIGIVITPATHLYPFIGVHNNNPSYPFIAGSYGSHLVASSFRSTMKSQKATSSPRDQKIRRVPKRNHQCVQRHLATPVTFSHGETHGVWQAQKRPFDKNPGV